MTTTPAPTRLEDTTLYQINRLRTVFHWLEDNAHTLPDGWNLQGGTSEHPTLVWWGHGSHDSTNTVDGAAAIERLSEAHGRPKRQDELGSYWRASDRRAVSLTVYTRQVAAAPGGAE